jgi:hypothetical protein
MLTLIDVNLIQFGFEAAARTEDRSPDVFLRIKPVQLSNANM